MIQKIFSKYQVLFELYAQRIILAKNDFRCSVTITISFSNVISADKNGFA